MGFQMSEWDTILVLFTPLPLFWKMSKFSRFLIMRPPLSLLLALFLQEILRTQKMLKCQKPANIESLE